MTPSVIEVFTAESRDAEAPPPRLMLATAGPGLMVTRHPVDPVDHTRSGAGAVAIQHAHGHQADPLGHTVGGAADRARHVRAVPVAVSGR